jgi:hypothetical protein
VTLVGIAKQAREAIAEIEDRADYLRSPFDWGDVNGRKWLLSLLESDPEFRLPEKIAAEAAELERQSAMSWRERYDAMDHDTRLRLALSVSSNEGLMVALSQKPLMALDDVARLLRGLLGGGP